MKKHLPILLFGSLALASAGLASCEKDTEEPKEYSLAITAGPGGRVEVAVEGVSSTTAPAGASVALTAIADEGYAFNGWSVENGGGK